jgi:hypothetical protein
MANTVCLNACRLSRWSVDGQSMGSVVSVEAVTGVGPDIAAPGIVRWPESRTEEVGRDVVQRAW